MAMKNSCGCTSPEGHLPYLPMEIKSLVAAHSLKSDLKIFRHVSKEWNTVATPFLFDRIYISPYDKDLQVFAEITQHPVLARSIKELICDTSSVQGLCDRAYFVNLRHEIRQITRASKGSPFYSSNRRLNNFINEIVQDGREIDRLFSKLGKDTFVIDGLRMWRKLAAESGHNMSLSNGQHGTYYTLLCGGLHELSNLQSVKMDNDIWDSNRMTTSLSCRYPHRPSSTLNPYLVLGGVHSGSPLARAWNTWYLRPKRSEREAQIFRSLNLTMGALAQSNRQIKRFQHDGRLYNGIPPIVFTMFKVGSIFPRSMIVALCQLERLELQITPNEHQLTNYNPAEALGFLPRMLERMTGLKRLALKLETAERIQHRRALTIPNVLEGSCLQYSQVFPHGCRWPHLEMFYLRGLAIDGFDLLHLLYGQMPGLKRLWLHRIDLLENSWQGVIEAMRYRHKWDLLSLQGHFRHRDREWWPCTPAEEEREHDLLQEYTAYVESGGRHPSLEPQCHDREALRYLSQMFPEASEKHRQVFYRYARFMGVRLPTSPNGGHEWGIKLLGP